MTFIRIVFAFLGGYALASATAILLGALPGDRGQNVLGGGMTAIAVWVAAAMWIFPARSIKQALLRAVATPALMVALAFWIGRGR